MFRILMLMVLLVYLLGVVATAVINFHESYVEGADTGALVSQAIEDGLRWPIGALRAVL
ncbi:MAG: hypothetical protein ACREDZ_12465 [Kiloniellales bacterium]